MLMEAASLSNGQPTNTGAEGQWSIPAIMVVTIDMQHFLAFDAQNTAA
jgi:hypothetical protein